MKARAIAMLGLAVVLAGAAVFLARNWIEEQTRPVVVQQAAPVDNTVTVVVAKDRLTFGNPLRKEQLRLVKWPGDAVPEGAFTSIEAVIGEEERVVLRAIEINEPVLQNKITGFGGKASLAAILSPEMRAVTIRVNDVAGVAGFVLPGDRVDVLLTRDRTGGQGGNVATNLITDVLLQNVKVLGIDQDANEDKEKPSVAKAVTLEVSPQQAQKLALASQLGSLALMLRNLADAEPEQVKTVSTRDLSVGEANDPPAVAEAPKKAPVKIIAKPKEDPFSAVRIVRGTDATSYEVLPDSRPALALTPPATKLAPVAPAVSAPAIETQKPATPAAPAFVKPLAPTTGDSGQETQVPGSGGQNPISLLPPELKASLN